MKQFVKVEEVENEGLESFFGKSITLFCTTYIYSGKLVGVNDKFVKIENPEVVFETGPFDSKTWKLAEKLPSPHYIQLNQLESFGPGK